MPILGTVLGWSSFGFAARCWALAIQKRNIFDNLGGHALSVGFWGSVGYAYYGWEQRVSEMLEDKKKALRDVREAETTKKNAGADGANDDQE